jgi:RHH-type transcriptional regulator, proline utilization regulon repressor / proline dehydrogenase / delta 1-pyrroline-5-carboxylate dehydrogenase
MDREPESAMESLPDPRDQQFKVPRRPSWGARLDQARLAVDAAYRSDEAQAVDGLLSRLRLSAGDRAAIADRARRLVATVRERRVRPGGIDAFLQEYGLDTREGVVLMCLAEALLRVPDAGTVDELIRDKLSDGNWAEHVGQSASVLVNASSWGLMLSGRILRDQGLSGGDLVRAMRRLVQRSGEPVIRQAMTQAMRIMGRQFVLAETIDAAMKESRAAEKAGYRYSYDMLGEAALTAADAARYYDAYAKAIDRVGNHSAGRGPIEGPGVSIKLSALHPRYEVAQADRVMAELRPRIVSLCELAKGHGIGICIDAEEADRLDLSLDLIAATATEPALAGWEGFGLALQAYQKRAIHLVDWLAGLAAEAKRRLMVRLVKGAYWDTEIKQAQVDGMAGYPVFTRKRTTDVSWLACAQALVADTRAFYPQFATHNAHSLAAAMIMANAAGTRAYEFQRLHGMGEPLYEAVVEKATPDARAACRIYAPVGGHRDLLAYLVRRLLENGANTSFVNRLADDELPIDEVIADPVLRTMRTDPIANPAIPLPAELFRPARANASGEDLSDRPRLAALAAAMDVPSLPRAAALVSGEPALGSGEKVRNPARRSQAVGSVGEANTGDVEAALAAGKVAHAAWSRRPVEERAACLERAADLYRAHRAELMALCVHEAGKTLDDAVAEVREAEDFLRYYAAEARSLFGPPRELAGPTGERNTLELRGRGVFACISPWNFPLAIFTGQVAAALVAGNAVLAKPAEQTPLIAHRAVTLMHQAGVPADVLHYLPGRGETIGAALTSHPRIDGVCFTGSVETARAINRALAARDGPIVPLIAETGGLNCMIVDSTALPEQVIGDVLTSAFRSAGQRCSALRAMFVQQEVADKLVAMLAGAMAELKVGDPADLATDVGPVIDGDAHAMLSRHAERMDREAKLIRACDAPDLDGWFFPPRAYEVDGLARIGGEVFGPILHVIRYDPRHLDVMLREIEASGYGLTFGLHSRIDDRAKAVAARLPIGNIYVNRSMIGAVVGVQPFGGEGLSGTGPKAGGPHYLPRFAIERAVSVNTTAAGGNASLLAQSAGDG